ncbi:hypothetical protein [Streptomyces rochei]|uniref:hypothetical protein n=1 Tax=Streptomyces rochei TaxID=1928 RepID=UPI0033A38D3D
MIESADRVVGLARELADRSSVDCREVRLRHERNGFDPVRVGRESHRLREAAAGLGSRVVIAHGVDAIAAEITRQRPAVVFNGIGDYAETAAVIARACMPGGHYLDLAADLTAVPRLLDLDSEAEQAGSTLVTGSGFGVLATEAVVIKLCEDRPAPPPCASTLWPRCPSAPESSAPPSQPP